jgi:hypothetical protein
MFIDNTNVTDINDLLEMRAFAKGLAIAFKTEEKDVQMGIIANGLRSHIHHITNPKTTFISKIRRANNHERNLIAHPRSRRTYIPKAGRRYRRAEAYLLVKQKKPIPPILNDVLFVLISGAESDVEVHAPVKEMKDAGAKIVAIGVGKDAKIGKLGSLADEKFMVPPGAGNAIVNAIVPAICKKCK